MLWATRCKTCDTKVRINALWSTIYNMMTIAICVLFLILTFNQLGVISIAITISIYLISLFAVEIFGPLVISAPPRRLNAE